MASSPSPSSPPPNTAPTDIDSAAVAQVQAFEQQLQTLQAMIAGQAPAADEPLADKQFLPNDLTAHLAQLQTSFREHLLPLATAQPVQTPVLTEMNRHLRVLNVDATYLQAARQATTRQQRITQICERLQQLAGFAQALSMALQEMAPRPGEP